MAGDLGAASCGRGRVADAGMEVTMQIESFLDDLPELDPVIYHELTDYGWRGLTAQGEVLEVRSSNGHAIEVPSEIIVSCGGERIGRRAIRNDQAVDIDDYLAHFNAVVALYKENRVDEALIESDATLRAAPTLRAKFNRAMILLASGRWAEGLDEYWQCEQDAPFMRPQVRAALDRGLQPWRGEDLRGRRLLVLHAHGFGDTIMMLRYLPQLAARGADVALEMPPELQRLTKRWPHASDGDYFCPILHLLRFLHVAPQSVDGSPYMAVDAELVARWSIPKGRKRIGIAWSIGKPSDGDYPREIPLGDLVAALGDAELHSVQVQGGAEAKALGVQAHEFDDFADCAALMLQMDEIVSVDTAALHLAGAIGHPRVYGLLSHWSSWRWVAPWYSNVRLCRQAAAGDWASALAQLHGH
ncbi:hypothetical protein NLM33_32945 [Bradyrhizobium sp. CCGUVB1N3]|uniref:hypothetical protein n=1 Tax=Bradyrhizobium sp. CCGUVB1N3 TaxID=2949629 RepID=UPI0020B38F45|nr:hypothetical protein [Bradyrhizobium sp. CCGUVB1N3]MCP3475133.1 hypothetical protein [Bradyrhizobium sp. CCGUVB1N3]